MTFCLPRRLILSTLAFAALVQFGGCATPTSGPSTALGVIGQNTELKLACKTCSRATPR